MYRGAACFLSTVYCLLSTVYCLLSTITYVLSTKANVYCLLFTVSHPCLQQWLVVLRPLVDVHDGGVDRLPAVAQAAPAERPLAESRVLLALDGAAGQHYTPWGNGFVILPNGISPVLKNIELVVSTRTGTLYIKFHNIIQEPDST